MYTIPFPTAVVPFRGGHPDSTIAPLLLSRTRTSSDNPGFNPDPADGRSDSAEAGGFCSQGLGQDLAPRTRFLAFHLVLQPLRNLGNWLA